MKSPGVFAEQPWFLHFYLFDVLITFGVTFSKNHATDSLDLIISCSNQCFSIIVVSVLLCEPISFGKLTNGIVVCRFFSLRQCKDIIKHFTCLELQIFISFYQIFVSFVCSIFLNYIAMYEPLTRVLIYISTFQWYSIRNSFYEQQQIINSLKSATIPLYVCMVLKLWTYLH